MTAEQILEKHLLLMLKRTDESYVSVDEMKQQPEWQATINAMLEYGEMQALRIHDVVGQSEQLLCPICSSGNVDAEFNHYNFCRDCNHDWAK
jgi:hypothetical protein